MHYIFSTKQRRGLITPDIRDRLWAYMGGIARENNMRSLAIGGTADHVHILIMLPSTLTIAKAIQLIKGGASKWVHDTFAEHQDFAWQEGYAAFSVSMSRLEATTSYIARQEDHHRTRTFEEEYLEFLDRYGIEYERKYVFD